MQQLRNAQTVNMSAELFEKLFLARNDTAYPQPPTQWAEDDLKSLRSQDAAAADWRKGLGNPTPMCVSPAPPQNTDTGSIPMKFVG
jgi:hypothetical protein